MAPTDRDATMSTVLPSIVPPSSRALARVQSRIADDGSDEDRSRIRNMWGHGGEWHERIDPEEAFSRNVVPRVREHREEVRIARVVHNRFEAQAEEDGEVFPSPPPTVPASRGGLRRFGVRGSQFSESNNEPVTDTVLDALEFDLTAMDEGEPAATTFLARKV